MSLGGEGGLGAFPVDVVLAVDSSAGITAEGFEEQRAYLQEFVDALGEMGYLGPAEVRVGIVDFTRTAALRQSLTASPQTLNTAIQRLKFRGNGRTEWGSSLSAGIDRASRELSERGRAGVRKLLIVLSDGDWNQGVDPVALANTLNGAQDIQFITVLTGAAGDAERRRDVLEAISSEGPARDVTDGAWPLMDVFLAGPVPAATNLRLVATVGNDFAFSSDEFFGSGNVGASSQVVRSSNTRSIEWTQDSFDGGGSLRAIVYYRGPISGRFPRTVPLVKSAVLTYVDSDGISRTVKFAKINVTLFNEAPATPGP